MKRKKREDFHNDFGYEMYLDRMYNALKLASEHLDYCGYGDSWERESAREQGLEDIITKALNDGNYFLPS